MILQKVSSVAYVTIAYNMGSNPGLNILINN